MSLSLLICDINLLCYGSITTLVYFWLLRLQLRHQFATMLTKITPKLFGNNDCYDDHYRSLQRCHMDDMATQIIGKKSSNVQWNHFTMHPWLGTQHSYTYTYSFFKCQSIFIYNLWIWTSMINWWLWICISGVCWDTEVWRTNCLISKFNEVNYLTNSWYICPKMCLSWKCD